MEPFLISQKPILIKRNCLYKIQQLFYMHHYFYTYIFIYISKKLITKTKTMKNQNLNKGKKLNKKELRTIMGGRKKCLYNNVCILIDRLCAEPICNPIEEPA